MSMISPEGFVELECKGKPYNELLKIRDELMESILAFEKGNISQREWSIDPSPDVVYQMNLEYLGELCKLISETYNIEVVCADEEEDDDEE